MDGSDLLPNDLRECQRLLLAAFQQATQLERRVAESEQQVAELNRVLSATSASHELLQQEHAATLDELAWYKRWAYGRRRERFSEGEGQGHLFDLDVCLPADADPESASYDDEVEVQGHRRRRKKREIDWDKLPQIQSACGHSGSGLLGACAAEILRCREKLSAGITPGAGMDSATVRY
jgi:hypothetical protein